MAYNERWTYYVGVLVVTMAVTICASAEFGTTTSPNVTVNFTPTARRYAEVIDVRPTTPSSLQTSCVLAAQDPFQEERIHDMVFVQNFNLIEYRLVFPNNTVNPLTHNMKSIYKASTLQFYDFVACFVKLK